MDPRADYCFRLDARSVIAARYQRLHLRIGNARLVLALLAVALAVLSLVYHYLSPAWLALPVVAFVALMIVHDRILRRSRRASRAVEFYRRGLDRLDDNWSDKGVSGARYLDDRHPYARDLDLFGPGSLFELLCAARTPTGELTLARWLASPAASAEVLARQQAVDELRNRVDLREDLAVLGEEIGAEVHPEALPRWAEHKAVLDSLAARIAALVLAVLTFPLGIWVVAVGLEWLANDVPLPAAFGPLSRGFLVLSMIEASLAVYYRRRVQQSVAEVKHPAHELALLSDILVRLESEQFTCARLATLRRALDTKGHPASREVARLRRLIELLDSRDNVAVRICGPFLMWTTQVAFAIEAWRARVGPSVRRWLEAVGEFEALSSLAGYGYEHPADPFPQLATGARYEGRALGHPLLPEARSVRNDVSLDAARQVWIVSGSNMSGKSTLLRTVGVNAVLAMAGAPVRAESLTLGPLTVGASIRVIDSLQEGTSRFYAEITRLRQIMDIASSDRNLLFLLDELLHGTNSHDRRIGAEALVRGLVNRGAIGLVTTHDLALAHIASELDSRAANVHFADELRDGKITFDYRLQPGVVEKSNALELMRSVGLEV